MAGWNLLCTLKRVGSWRASESKRQTERSTSAAKRLWFPVSRPTQL